MTSKWRQRSEEETASSAASGRGKRVSHPSPAYGSPSAGVMDASKRVSRTSSLELDINNQSLHFPTAVVPWNAWCRNSLFVTCQGVLPFLLGVRILVIASRGSVAARTLRATAASPQHGFMVDLAPMPRSARTEHCMMWSSAISFSMFAVLFVLACFLLAHCLCVSFVVCREAPRILAQQTRVTSTFYIFDLM